MKFEFKSKLWVWPGNTAQWRFVTVPKDLSQKVRSKIKVKRGFGSVRVIARIGKTKWDTSIFPDSKSDMYLLPVKVSVRRSEGIDDNDAISVVLLIK